MTRSMKSTGRLVILAAMLSIFWGGTSAQANLITNGGFEDATGWVDAGDKGDFLLPGSTTITGWTVTGDTGSNHDLAWFRSDNPYGVVPHTGNYSLDLSGSTVGAPYTGVKQTIATVAGSEYLLSFYLGASSDGSNSPTATILASAGDKSDVSLSNTYTVGGAIWQLETMTFTATSASTLVTLQGSVASYGGNYIGLDDVSVSAVPEPTSFALLGLGGAGLFVGHAIRRRRQHKTAALPAEPLILAARNESSEDRVRRNG